MGNITLKQSGLRVYITGLTHCRMWAEPAAGGTFEIRIESRGMPLMSVMDAKQDARRALTDRNGGREPQTMQDVLALLKRPRVA